MKLLSGIVLGAVLALGGTYVYKHYICGCASAKSEAPHMAEVGKTAPDFTLKNQDGVMIQLSSFVGKGPIVLEWFNKDCPYVKKFYGVGAMQRLQLSEAEKGVTWLRITSSAPNKQGFMDEATAKAQHEAANASQTLVDPTGDVGRMYGAKTTPNMFVIDNSGKLVYSGAIDSIKSFDSADIANSENYVISALEAVRAGQPVATAQTTPYGCGVKY